MTLTPAERVMLRAIQDARRDLTINENTLRYVARRVGVEPARLDTLLCERPLYCDEVKRQLA